MLKTSWRNGVKALRTRWVHALEPCHRSTEEFNRQTLVALEKSCAQGQLGSLATIKSDEGVCRRWESDHGKSLSAPGLKVYVVQWEARPIRALAALNEPV